MANNEVSKRQELMNPGNLDALRGPYPTIAAANLAIPSNVVAGENYRKGKFVEIGINDTFVTHWWKGGYTDAHLVEYNTGKETYPIFYVDDDMNLMGTNLENIGVNFQLNDNSELIINIP